MEEFGFALNKQDLLLAFAADSRRDHFVKEIFGLSDEFITVWRVGAGDLAVQLPLHGDVKCRIDWGDGSLEDVYAPALDLARCTLRVWYRWRFRVRWAGVRVGAARLCELDAGPFTTAFSHSFERQV